MSSIPTAVRHGLVRDQARLRGGAWITCASESMTPTVRPGQRVRVHAAPHIRSGDVVLFETSGGDDLVLHRVVFAPFWSSWFVHVGDAGKRAGISRRDRVIGRADLPARLPSLRALWKSSARLYAAARRHR